MTRSHIGIIALLSVFAVTGPAGAASNSRLTINADGYPQVRVYTAGLDLTQTADAQEMLERLQAAVVTVCSNGYDERDSSGASAYASCTSRALKRAVAATQSPLVARLSETPEMKAAAAAGTIAAQ